MKKNMSLQKKLQDILSQKSFEELEYYKKNKSWKSWAADDRNLLASLFVMQGEKQLEQGDKNGLESFDLATKVAPENPEIFYRIGLALLRDKDRNPSTQLEAALNAFKQCLAINNDYFDAWVTQGITYNYLGLQKEDSQYFQEAMGSFENAQARSSEECDSSLAELYWNWGVSAFWSGRLSGEAVDFHTAIDRFRLAASKGLQDKGFWLAYGDAVAELGLLLGRDENFYEAIELYRNAVRQAFDYFEGWLHLGCAFQHLFEQYKTDELFRQANECFRMASEIEQEQAILWMKWAQLLSTAGKIRHELELLQASLEKFEKAYALEPAVPLVLSLWGETLTLIGTQTENIETLREAEYKICRSLELNRDLPESWYIYGNCLSELGNYFSDEEYYRQAIQKYQIGLSLRQHEPLLWYGLASAYFSIGEITGEASWVETACKLFNRVIEFGGQDFRRFWNDWGVALMTLAELRHDRSCLEAAIEKFEHLLGQNLEQTENEDEQEAHPDWYYNWGCAYDFLGDFTEEIGHYEKAIQLLTKTLQLDAEHAHAHYNLALAWAHLGDVAMDVEAFHKSIEQFQFVLSRNGEDEMAWNDFGLTLIHLAQLIQDPSKPEQSQKLYEVAESKLMQAVALGCTQAYYNLACLYSLTDNFEAAMQYLDKAAIAESLPPLEELMHDEWLDALRQTPSFRAFIEEQSKD
jgi:tetratricopeptide (TPR) repeat protein